MKQRKGRLLPENLKRTRPEVPLSEKTDKQKYEATAQDCVDDLQQVARSNEGKVISRNFYRENGSYSDSVWSRYFGSFEEFKRQAGLHLTRQQHLLEKQIAKQASVDHYHKLDREIADYEGKYQRPSDKRWVTIVNGADFHDENVDPFFLRVFIDAVRRIQPDIVNFGGDIWDATEFGKYSVDPRLWDPVKKMRFVHNEILKPVRKAAPNAQIDYLEGNHSYRLRRHLADASPAMLVVLEQLHGMTTSKLMGLDQFEINYIARGSLAAFTSKDMKKELMRNYKVYDNAVLIHHFPEEAVKLGIPGTCGHHHKLHAWPCSSAVYGAYNFYQIGCGHRTAATYCDGENWTNGFMVIHYDRVSKKSVFEYVDIRDHAVVGGKWYFRQPDEI